VLRGASDVVGTTSLVVGIHPCLRVAWYQVVESGKGPSLRHDFLAWHFDGLYPGLV
jgi:hypothetical protein